MKITSKTDLAFALIQAHPPLSPSVTKEPGVDMKKPGSGKISLLN